MSQLVLIPTPLTYQRLKTMMSGSPVHIEWDTMHIMVVDNAGDVNVQNQEYEATFQAFGFEWDEQLGRTTLVGILQSEGIARRMQELGEPNNDIKLIFSANAAAGRGNRGWISSTSSTLVEREGVFTFGPEHLIG